MSESLEKIQKAVASDAGGSVELLNQFEALNEELGRRRDECLQLKAVLASRAKDSVETAKESYGGDTALLNEVRNVKLPP